MRAAATGARTVPPREHGGNCDIKDLSRGARVYFPVYVKGAGLSMGDLHFSQGDGEITFCGAIEMAGLASTRVILIKGGMEKYGIKNPIFKPSPIKPNYKDYLIFEGISVDEAGKQHYLDMHIGLSAGLPQRDRISEEIRLFRRPGLFDPRHRAGAGAYFGHRRRAQCLRHFVSPHGNFRIRHQSRRGRAETVQHERDRHADLAGPVGARPCRSTIICARAAARSRK